jgi:hypothetical protein
MKIITLTIVLFFTLSSITQAEENNNMVNNINTHTVRTLEIQKSSQSGYDEFVNLFSDYDGTWAEDMFIYSADFFLPDEMMRATKDVLKNRKDEGHSDQTEKLTKSLGNDAYNMFLTTMYYYMQDVSQITERVWSDEVCTPDTFTYNKDKEPKNVFLDLKATDKNARGVTEYGIVLPVNENFPNAFYPYAQTPDGCSAEGLHDLYRQSNKLSDDDKWLKNACNEHDRCYSTIGTSSQECNSQFIVRAINSCNAISMEKTVLTMGSKNAFCGFKGLIISIGANSCAKKYFDKAQRQQKMYIQWVTKYEKEYNKEKDK